MCKGIAKNVHVNFSSIRWKKWLVPPPVYLILKSYCCVFNIYFESWSPGYCVGKTSAPFGVKKHLPHISRGSDRFSTSTFLSKVTRNKTGNPWWRWSKLATCWNRRNMLHTKIQQSSARSPPNGRVRRGLKKIWLISSRISQWATSNNKQIVCWELPEIRPCDFCGIRLIDLSYWALCGADCPSKAVEFRDLA